ncbi:hypothetical protein D9756_009144 [Leucocoprinus leucothites]|uniref:Uncharacterized protein n=1 Tax=Leucocoprinus leucothites TaxID=201217 RepID=A0A8H5FVC8_9AGAR|nr:hypothetical protein D9756_009144 [Leucoagaricus leucothites]
MAGYYSNTVPAYTHPRIPWHAAWVCNNYAFGTVHNHHDCGVCGVYMAHALTQFQYPSISPSVATTSAFPNARQQGGFEYQHGFQEGFNAGRATLSCADDNKEDNSEEGEKEKGCGAKAQAELLENAQAEIDHLRNQLVVLQQTYDELMQRVSLTVTQSPGAVDSALSGPDPRIALSEVGEYTTSSSNDDSTTEDSHYDESFHHVCQSRTMDNDDDNGDQNIDWGSKEEVEREEASNKLMFVINNRLARASDNDDDDDDQNTGGGFKEEVEREEATNRLMFVIGNRLSRASDNDDNNNDQNTDGGLKEEVEREEASNKLMFVIGNRLARPSDKVSPSTSTSRPTTPHPDKKEGSPSPPSCPPRPQSEVLTISVGQIRELMDRAHCIDEEALAQVKLLVSQARATPPSERTEVHTVLLTEWRRPLGQSLILNLSVPSLGLLPSVGPVYVDASTVGIGFIFNNQWEAWRLRNGWQQEGWRQGNFRGTQWAEAVAVELGVRVMIKARYVGREITICSDNMQVVRAFSEGKYVGERLAHEVVSNTERLCQQLKIQLKVLWIPGVNNPADQISRLNVGSAADRFPCRVGIPPILQDVVAPFYQ